MMILKLGNKMLRKASLLVCVFFGGVLPLFLTVHAEQPTSAADTIDKQNTQDSKANAIANELTIATPQNDKVTTPQMNEATLDTHDLSVMGMYRAADVVVKSVMIGLLLASLVCWAVCILKSMQLKIAKRDAKKLLAHLVHSESFAQANQNLVQQKSDALQLLRATEHELKLTAKGPATDEALKERVVARLERVQASLSTHMNQGTGLLATIGSVAPFIGLFGTVWGIMNSFIGIAETQTTNLAVVAPGIAEALLATALGLVAAIPAVVMYNHFSRSITSYKAQLADILTAIMILVSRDLDRAHPQAKPLADLLNNKRAVAKAAKES